MFAFSELLAFLAAVLVLVIVPGPNTMIILAQTLGGGRSAGLATVAGVELGTLVHTIAAALGLSALLSTSALAFTAVKFAGVAYLIVIGFRMIRQPAMEVSVTPAVGLVAAFRRALFTNLLNPKVALFFLAFLPQFVHPERGSVFLQFVILGLLLSLVGICLGAILVLVASSLARWLRSHTSWVHLQQRITGGVLIGLGVRLAFVRAS